jgi:hypothetical protein
MLYISSVLHPIASRALVWLLLQTTFSYVASNEVINTHQQAGLLREAIWLQNLAFLEDLVAPCT